jgi:hypothetical protein
MQFHYKQFEIDASSLAEGGRFFARAKILRRAHTEEDAVEVKWSGDIGEFASDANAVEAARQWAMRWCDQYGERPS